MDVFGQEMQQLGSVAFLAQAVSGGIIQFLELREKHFVVYTT